MSARDKESQIRIVHVDMPEDLKIRAQELALQGDKNKNAADFEQNLAKTLKREFD